MDKNNNNNNDPFPTLLYFIVEEWVLNLPPHLFFKIFRLGNAGKITGHLFRIFDSDGNDFLDFKEFLMAIDVANRDTGWTSNKITPVQPLFLKRLSRGGGVSRPINKKE